MTKISSFDELLKLRDQVKPRMSLREKSLKLDQLSQIKVCFNDAIAKESRDLLTSLLQAVETKNVPAIVIPADNLGKAEERPFAEVVFPDGKTKTFANVDASKFDSIINCIEK